MHVKRLPARRLVLLIGGLPTFLTPRQNHLPVEVDDLVVQPMARLQPLQVVIRHLFPHALGDGAAFAEKVVHGSFIAWWQRGRERLAFGSESVFKLLGLEQSVEAESVERRTVDGLWFGLESFLRVQQRSMDELRTGMLLIASG